jgi:hypothetical protein
MCTNAVGQTLTWNREVAAGSASEAVDANVAATPEQRARLKNYG